MSSLNIFLCENITSQSKYRKFWQLFWVIIYGIIIAILGFVLGSISLRRFTGWNILVEPLAPIAIIPIIVAFIFFVTYMLLVLIRVNKCTQKRLKAHYN